MQYIYNIDPITIGVRGLCYPCTILGRACLVSFLMGYTRGHVKLLFLLMAAIMTAFTGALALYTPDNPGYTITMATFAAFGNGALVVPALTLAFYAAPDEFVGTVGALSLSVRFMGGSIGTSIFFNTFFPKSSEFLPRNVAGAAMSAGVSDPTILQALVVAYASQVPGAASMVQGVTATTVASTQYASQMAYAEALKYVWYATIPFRCCELHLLRILAEYQTVYDEQGR